MLTIIALVLAYLFLDWPWRAVVVVPAAVIDLAQIAVWLRLRKRRSITGAESMVGQRGRATTECRPHGQVATRGQIWRARCPGGASAGQQVVVTGVEGITLIVEAIDGAEPPRTPGAYSRPG